MKPSIGRTVHYRLTEEEALATNKRRADADQNRETMRATRPGFQAHVGNVAAPGDVVAMVITGTVTSHVVNGQAFLDGNDSLWVMAAYEGDGPGKWAWPERVT
ncbi:MAG: hypothetical protein QF744_15040 [SAR202 cluster bacterium]|jgi:hypothetical protein|nr:hypothetical protein [SAR202 cluster bacterium]